MRWSHWRWELAALATSFASLAGLVILLAMFDNQSTFEWKGISLNTIISILAVTMKALIIYAVAECTGQWKWIAFTQSKRQLLDFERIDLASRGPLGSLQLLLNKQTPWVLRLGVSIVVLALALDPFSQQLLRVEASVRFVDTTQDQDGNKLNATSPRASHYNLGSIPWMKGFFSETHVPGGSGVDMSMQIAILSALKRFQSAESIRQQLEVTCPTGNCTWGTFHTLGVCHRCVDLTDRIKTVQTDFRSVPKGRAGGNVSAKVLPNGHFLANTHSCDLLAPFEDLVPLGCAWKPEKFSKALPSYLHTLFSTGLPNETNAMHDIDTMIWASSVLHVNVVKARHRMDNSSGEPPDLEPLYWHNASVGAEECALFYCVKSIRTRVEGNRVVEDVEEIENIELSYSGGNWSLDFPTYRVNDRSPSFEGELHLRVPHEPKLPLFSIRALAVWSINVYLRELFYGLSNEAWSDSQILKDLLKLDNVNLFTGFAIPERTQPESLSILHPSLNTSLQDGFERLATSMTNEMRHASGLDTDRGLSSLVFEESDEYEGPVKGRIGITITTYRTRWPWIVLHGVISSGATAFCLLTIASAKNNQPPVPVWKTSMLAAVSEASGAAACSMAPRRWRSWKTGPARPSSGSWTRKALCFRTVGTRATASLIGLRTVKMRILREFPEAWGSQLQLTVMTSSSQDSVATLQAS